MRYRAAVAGTLLALVAMTGFACGGSDEAATSGHRAVTQDPTARRESQKAQAEARHQRAAIQRQARREARRARIRAQRRAAHREKVRAQRRAAREAARAAEKAAQAEAETQASNCDPNYSGACLDPNASDYDCAGGSGDGPEYTGPVHVVGSDHYGLDSDGDGYACE
jgi:FKBP-type peptidyl-prolyl cis-trans isomerase